MFLWKVLSIIKTWSIDVNCTVAMVSSTYRFHGVIYSVNLGSSVLSNSTINIPAITGPKGDPIATPSHCWCISLLNVKCTFFVHESNSSFISDLLMLVCILFSYSKIKGILLATYSWNRKIEVIRKLARCFMQNFSFLFSELLVQYINSNFPMLFECYSKGVNNEE